MTFYVSLDGDDANDGLSRANAWKSLARVSSYRGFSAGDRILFRCGDTFYGKLEVKVGAQRSPSPVVVAAFGSSSTHLPVLSFYKSINANSWIEQGGGVWATPINDPASTAGNLDTIGAAGANIGHLNIDGELWSGLKPSRAALSNDWDFYSDGALLYVKSIGRPGARAKRIQAAPDGQCIANRGNLKIRDLIFEGCGGNAASFSASTGVDIQWCWFRNIGGSVLRNGLRYGNGVQWWTNCSNCIASNNLFTDVYDTATTLQGYPIVNPTDGWRNIEMNDNIAVRCSQAVELWNTYGATSGQGTPPAGAGMRTVTSLRWVLFDMQQGGLVLPGHQGSSDLAQFLVYRMEAPLADVQLSISRMSNCPGLLIANDLYGVQPLPPGIIIKPSALTMTSDQMIQTGYPKTASQFDEWAIASGAGGGSTMMIDDKPAEVSDVELQALWASRRAQSGNIAGFI